ncbi:MAG: hypothetical protein HWN68_06110, partial [Desulfobacterales bacterium]|nr:hypothetical protein [Desulfobacterales bacterium]
MAKKHENGQPRLKEETKTKKEAQANEEEPKDRLSLEEEIRTDEEATDFSCRDEMRSMQRDSEIQRLNQRITL